MQCCEQLGRKGFTPDHNDLHVSQRAGTCFMTQQHLQPGWGHLQHLNRMLSNQLTKRLRIHLMLAVAKHNRHSTQQGQDGFQDENIE
ncbi:hypothetical protein D3C74_300010 [compost metagenome]